MGGCGRERRADAPHPVPPLQSRAPGKWGGPKPGGWGMGARGVLGGCLGDTSSASACARGGFGLRVCHWLRDSEKAPGSMRPGAGLATGGGGERRGRGFWRGDGGVPGLGGRSREFRVGKVGI